MADSIDAPENMIRCIVNSSLLASFCAWTSYARSSITTRRSASGGRAFSYLHLSRSTSLKRTHSWHRSFNRWILRYLYLPLGGRNNSLWSTALVFTFVAVWHDLSLNLLLWGWAISLFILPEVGARYLLPSAKVLHCSL